MVLRKALISLGLEMIIKPRSPRIPAAAQAGAAAAVAIVETRTVCVLVRRLRGYPEVRVG